MAAQRKVAPVSSSKIVDVGEPVDTGTVTFAAGDEPKLVQPAAEVEVIATKHISKDKADILAFMEEKVRVFIPESDNKYAERVIQVSNDGRSVFFTRGVDQIVPRKYVEVLARATPSTFGNVEKRDESTGEQQIVYPKRTAQRYPFSVIGDSPRGAEWLKRLQAEIR